MARLICRHGAASEQSLPSRPFGETAKRRPPAEAPGRAAEGPAIPNFLIRGSGAAALPFSSDEAAERAHESIKNKVTNTLDRPILSPPDRLPV